MKIISCFEALKFIKKNKSLGVMTDVALDPYTDHGHDGIVLNGIIDNDETNKILCNSQNCRLLWDLMS